MCRSKRRRAGIRLSRAATALLVCCALSSATLAEDAPLAIARATTVDCKGVIDLMSTAPGVVVVDNRKQADFDSGHIEGAIRVLDTDPTPERLSAAVTSKATPVLFYCNEVKCGSAANATAKAVEWGYASVYYYADGIHDWKAHHQLPLVTR